MAISATDFVDPQGDITQEMFPGEDLTVRAQGYLDALTSLLSTTFSGDQLDSALYYGVYVRFYEAAAAKVVASPIQGSLVDQASVQWAANRSEQYLKLAAKYQALYDSLFITTQSPGKYPSGAVPTRITAP